MVVSLKKITNLYYVFEQYLRKLFGGLRKETVEEAVSRIRSEHTDNGYLHRNVVYCLKLLRLLDLDVLRGYVVAVGIRIHLNTAHPNAYELIRLLNLASKQISANETVSEKIQRSRENPLNLRRVTLDDYLVTPDDAPIVPLEVYNAIILQLEFIQKGLTSAGITRQGSVDYYNRQLSHLMGEVEALTLAFLEIPHVRQRKPQSDAGDSPRP
jgi:hypothetical protein